MGVAVWVLPEGAEEDDWDHSAVLRQEKQLDRLARGLGETEFTKLLDFSDIAAEYDGDVEPTYLEPSDALATVAALAEAIRSGSPANNLNRQHEVLEELEDMCEKLKKAEAEGMRVRLSVIRNDLVAPHMLLQRRCKRLLS